jgi:hypothetical protein
VAVGVGVEAFGGQGVYEGAFADDGVGQAAVLEFAQRPLGGHGGHAVGFGHLAGGG